MLPGVEEEAIQGTNSGETECGRHEGQAQTGYAGDGRDEDGGWEEKAYRDLFGEAMLLGRGCGARVNEEQPGAEQASEENVEVEDGVGCAMEEKDEGKAGEKDGREEAVAMAVMETVALFKVAGGGAGEEGFGIEEAVGGVEHPDGEEHGEGVEAADTDAGAAGDEDGPGGGDGGGVERKEMPEDEGRAR